MAEDSQQQRQAKHDGHAIQVTATRSPNGRWMWSYLVDGTTYSVGRVPCPDAETALRQGFNAAKARIDGMK